MTVVAIDALRDPGAVDESVLDMDPLLLERLERPIPMKCTNPKIKHSVIRTTEVYYVYGISIHGYYSSLS